jgi:hypothetical protein
LETCNRDSHKAATLYRLNLATDADTGRIVASVLTDRE